MRNANIEVLRAVLMFLMKAWLLFGSLAIVAVAIIGGAICTTDKFAHGVGYGDDLRLRMNEISCLREGVNPYDVWSERVEHPTFVRFQNEQAVAAGKKPLNCYTPWAYVYLMPINLLPESVGAPVYLGLMILAVAVLGVVAYRCGLEVRGRRDDGFVVAAIAIMMPSMIFSDCTVLNFGILITASFALMMVLLERRHDVLAGLCLAFAMTKPQMAVLFLVPLIVRRKFLVLFVGGVVCVVTALVSSWLCKTSPVSMILQAVSGSVAAFVGCDLMPYPAFELLRSVGGGELLPRVLAAILGLGLCIMFTLRVRNGSWLELFLPASVFATAFTYTTLSNRVLAYFTLLALAIVWLRGALPWWQGAFALFFLLRPADGLCRILVMASGVLAEYRLPFESERLVLMLFSLVAFVVAVWVMVTFRRKSDIFTEV